MIQRPSGPNVATHFLSVSYRQNLLPKSVPNLPSQPYQNQVPTCYALDPHEVNDLQQRGQ